MLKVTRYQLNTISKYLYKKQIYGDFRDFQKALESSFEIVESLPKKNYRGNVPDPRANGTSRNAINTPAIMHRWNQNGTYCNSNTWKALENRTHDLALVTCSKCRRSFEGT